ncbi:MAG TPA: alpha-amylase family glycosyl hydrolase [Gemmatimonadales bacterium]|nr:alpha-amylase family glycosyl hydrolase [Gemmatimonadales bacterium]
MKPMRSMLVTGATVAATLLSVTPLAAQRAEPSWVRGATCYEVFVRSFFDSNGDGIGDLKGLIEKLDYINDGNPASKTDLGASCIWLMPIAKSPSYHGYDVSDYYDVDSVYGTNADFKHLVAAAHAHGIKVIVDMVLNHTSSQHPHFQAALHDTASPYRSWYRFSPVPLDSVGPWGAPVWRKSPVRDEYYYGLFSRGMPDLNYDTPAVREEGMKIAKYWLATMGADGLRLDAVQYLVEQGKCMKDCEGTHQYLREYGTYIEKIDPGAFTVGEVWDSIGEMLTYYPNQLTSYFMFPIADSLKTAVNRGTVGGMLAGYLRLQDTVPFYRYSTILDNHDMTRIMTALHGNMHRARLAATLLLTLPGLPFVYYGEPLGMIGDKPDPRLRTPMQWTGGPGVGFTTGTPWERPQSDSATANVAVETGNPNSLLNLYRHLIHLRKANSALAVGRLVPLSADDPHVVAYLRRDGAQVVLVVANLDSAAVHHVALTSGGGALPAGRYVAKNLLGGPGAAALRVRTDGRITGYVPAGTLTPEEFRVLELDRASR